MRTATTQGIGPWTMLTKRGCPYAKRSPQRTSQGSGGSGGLRWLDLAHFVPVHAQCFSLPCVKHAVLGDGVTRPPSVAWPADVLMRILPPPPPPPAALSPALETPSVPSAASPAPPFPP